MSPDNGELDYENSSVDVLKMEDLMYEVPDDLLKPMYANEVKEKATPSCYDEPALRTVSNELYNIIDKGTPPTPEYSSLNFNQYESVNMGMGLPSDPVYSQLERKEQHRFSSDTDKLIPNLLHGGTPEREEQPTSNMDTDELVPNPLYGGTLERDEQPTSNMDTEELISNPLYGGTLENEEQPTSNMDTEELIPNPLYGGTLENEEQPTSNMDTEELIPNPLYGGTLEREEESKFHSSESQHMLLSNEKVALPTLNYDYVEHRQTSALNTPTYDHIRS